MKSLDLSLPTPEENLACDEALLDAAEEESGGEVLRFWMPTMPFVVLGVSNAAATEVDLDACRQRGVPVLRRRSGGGCVLQGPGCFNFALVLRIPESGPLTTIAGTNAFVLGRHAAALSTLLGDQVAVMGLSDLTLAGRKFSGNAQRRRQRSLLYHGTILLSLDLRLLEILLPFPSQAPAYRSARPHREFLTNLGLEPAQVRKALVDTWECPEPAVPPPEESIRVLVAERYARPEWSMKR
jgi:lipoate-protein ligase A